MAEFSPHQQHGKYSIAFGGGVTANSYTAPIYLNQFRSVSVFCVYKPRKYSGLGVEHNYLLSNYHGDDLFRGICFRDEKTMCIHGGAGVGGERRVLVNTWPKSNPCELMRWVVICVDYAQPVNFSSLWVNGAHVTNFSSVDVKGGTRGMVIGDKTVDSASNINSFHGDIAAVEIYSQQEGYLVDGVKIAIMTTLAREYGIRLDT
jgi:hypothetical protein